MRDNAYAVILAGGYGERFWPSSTSKRPKQLLSLLSDQTMLGMAVDRLEGLIPPERIIVLTNGDLVAPTRAAAPYLPAENVIGEPMRRDTAAAVALAAAVVSGRDPNGVFCILTADHVMGDLPDYRATLDAAMGLALDQEVLVTIGIKPAYPATAYGYVEEGAAVEVEGPIDFARVERFVEKPDLETAESYVASGSFWWNSGMFIWSAATVRNAFAQHRPQLATLIDELAPAVDTDGFADALAAAFEPLEKISIDYALMEKADNIVMARGVFEWDDVGSWPAVANHFDPDEAGNVVIGDAAILDGSNNIVRSEGGMLTALLGVDDLIVVQAEGVTMVCPKDRAEEVKKLVALVRDMGRDDLL